MYNQEKVKDLSRVVCPPYDIISSQAQSHYHSLNPYNLIHILLGKDIHGEDKYKRAKNYFKDWIKNKILIQDSEPCIYFYSQQFNLKGEKRTRLGFISLLHLDEKNSSIFSHERTRPQPKEDRFRLIKQVKANLSPIFVIFLDNKRIIQRTYQHHIQGKNPILDITDTEKVIHKLWRIDSPDIIDNVGKGMSGENIFIADGHHRYEVACAYRDLMKKKLGDAATAGESFNYILSYFTNVNSRSLSILPVHRMVKLGAKFDFDEFKLSLKNYFDFVEKIRDKAHFLFLMEKGGCTENVLGMYKDKKYYLLRLKNIKILDKMMSDKLKDYRTLDVSILNHIILKKILGLDIEDKENINFSACADEFIEKVDNSPSLIAFILNPVKVQQIISLALNGERMPSKSTYFYPKVLSGMVINKFNEDKS